MGKVCLLALQRPEIRQEYVPTAIPPYYKATLHCTNSALGLWIILSFLYSAVLLFLVLFLAIQTRHISKDDTKKVNFFFFLVVIILAIAILLEVVFIEAGIDIGADVSEWLAYFAVVVICQVCLLKRCHW